jgi:Tol biopolymer transport system component
MDSTETRSGRRTSAVSWSPDSQSLIFTNSTEDDLRLYLAAPDGTHTRPLLDFSGNGLGEWAPALRPDSQ